jgi:hypothetical protein
VSDAPRIYSNADSDVTPPELRHPQLPLPLLSGVQSDVNTIELIVSEGVGTSALTTGTPRRMADMMP